MENTTAAEVLACPMEDNDADAKTVREYLIALLKGVWEAEEGFSGKRPFGNSGWKWDVIEPLVKNGLVDGKLDSDGLIEECDKEEANRLIVMAIESLH